MSPRYPDIRVPFGFEPESALDTAARIRAVLALALAPDLAEFDAELSGMRTTGEVLNHCKRWVALHFGEPEPDARPALRLVR